jgi:hypothetical protein
MEFGVHRTKKDAVCTVGMRKIYLFN